MSKRKCLVLPVVSTGAEYLVMGHLMRRNILAFKAPDRNEGYDLVCIHPNPSDKVKASKNKPEQIRIQVKSRYATDCNGTCLINAKSFKAFDYLACVFMNIGNFIKKNGSEERREPEIFIFPIEFVKKHHDASSKMQKLKVKKDDEFSKYRGDDGIEQIASALGVKVPKKQRGLIV